MEFLPCSTQHCPLLGPMLCYRKNLMLLNRQGKGTAVLMMPLGNLFFFPFLLPFLFLHSFPSLLFSFLSFPSLLSVFPFLLPFPFFPFRLSLFPFLLSFPSLLSFPPFSFVFPFLQNGFTSCERRSRAWTLYWVSWTSKFAVSSTVTILGKKPGYRSC